MFKRFMLSLKHRDTIRIGDFIIAPNVFNRPPTVPWGIMLFLVSVVLICSGGWLFLIPFALLIPLLFLSIGTLYGGNIAVHISTSVSRARSKGHLEILSTTPTGIAGSIWATTSAIYHSRQSLKQLKETAQAFYTIASILITIYITVNFIAGIFTGIEFMRMVRTVTNTIPTLLFIGALYIDLLQSIILGCLIGMLVPTYTRNQLDSSAVSFLLFFTIQILYYTAFILIAFWLLPQIIDWHSNALRALVQFVFFFIVREFLISYLWHLLAVRMSSDTHELGAIVGI